jgi:hypothetical protein
MPVQLSAPEFEVCILLHLAMPKRGLKCTLGSCRVFHLILWGLSTGMQWQCVPVPTDAHGNPVIHDTTVYKVFAPWADDGSLVKRAREFLWRGFSGKTAVSLLLKCGQKFNRHGGVSSNEG